MISTFFRAIGFRYTLVLLLCAVCCVLQVLSLGKSFLSHITSAASLAHQNEADSTVLCGVYKGTRVMVRKVDLPSVKLTRNDLIELQEVRLIILSHPIIYVLF